MMKKIIVFLFFLSILSATYSQIGIRAGVNSANQDFKNLPDNINVSSLTAFHVGLVYQWMPDYLLFNWFGLGAETGVLFSQKGSMFNLIETNQTGYNELNYIDIPLNLHLRFKLSRSFGLYAYGGAFASVMINGKTVFDEVEEDLRKWELNSFNSRFDYGYSIGGGIDILRKLQIGINYSQSMKNLLPVQYVTIRMQSATSIHNKLYSVNITFLF